MTNTATLTPPPSVLHPSFAPPLAETSDRKPASFFKALDDAINKALPVDPVAWLTRMRQEGGE